MDEHDDDDDDDKSIAILHEEVAIAKVYLLKCILWGDSYIATA